MGYPTKVQLIRRKKTADPFYINFSAAVAEAMGLSKGETVPWEGLTICNGPKTTKVRYKRTVQAKWHARKKPPA